MGGISLALNVLGYTMPRLAGYAPPEIFYTYISPLVIWTSMATVLLFQGIHIEPNKIINWISKSVFAVYIIHQSPFIAKTLFKPTVQDLYSSYTGLTCLISIFALLLCYFFISIVLDKIRIYIWDKIAAKIKWH